MKETKEISTCSEAVTPQSEPGLGDDVPCEMCGGALDTGCECTECNHDNWQAVYGKPRPPPNWQAVYGEPRPHSTAMQEDKT